MSAAERRAAVREVLLSSVRGRRRELEILLAWSLLEAVPAFLSGRLVATALDDGFLDGRTGAGLAWLGALALAVLIGGWATRQVFLRLARVVEPFRDELARLAVGGALRRSTAPGAIPDTAAVARLTGQVEIVRDAYASVLLVTQGFVISTAGALLGLLTLAPLVLVLVLPPLAAGLALFFMALGRMAERQRASILADERIAESASAVTGGLRDVIASGGEERVAATVGGHIDEQARATTELARFTAVRSVSISIGGLLPVVLILAAGPWLLDHGLTAGGLIGALTYLSQGIHGSLQTLIRGLGNTGLWLLVTLNRLVETSPPPPDEAARAAATEQPGDARRPGRLILRHLTFGYGSSPSALVEQLQLLVPEGEHLGIVGPSGVGKSTLANLIAGILDPQEGDVYLGNSRVGDLPRKIAAGRRVLIPQEAYVFAGTVWENIAYFGEGVRRAEVDTAVDELGARDLVERLGGYDAELDPGSLSAGERQLITLVRAYVSPAPLVVLDEATCHLDPAAEARVEKAFAARDGTLIVIAHRISSALRARRILVMDGERIDVGTHEDLLERSALYRDLVGRWATGTPASAQGPAPVTAA